MKRFIISMALPVVVAFAGCSQSHDKHEVASTGPLSTAVPSTQLAGAAAVDLHNTVCPVSGDKVESSPLTEAYEGKVYHLCCNDCIKPFKQDPGKFAKAVEADPAKYGVKK